MTRKDFNLIAKVIKTQRDFYPDDLIIQTVYDHLVEELIVELATTNDQFNADRFREACR